MNGAARQPWLHEMVVAVQAPAVAVSPTDGQVRGPGAGWYVADRRVLSGLVVMVDDVEPVALVGESTGAAHAHFVGSLRGLGDAGKDATVFVERDRSVTGTTVREVITLVSRARDPFTCTLRLALATDLALIFDVNAGRAVASLPAEAGPTTTRWRASDGVTAIAVYSPAADVVDLDGSLRWEVTLERHESWSLALEVAMADDPVPPVVLPVLADAAFTTPVARSGDLRLVELVDRSAADLAGLLVADAAEPGDQTFAAGAPWYLTLFGRDSLWTARMTLPLGTAAAGGTLRTLARRQGTRSDPKSEQTPGKILHELRRAPVDLPGIMLPPVYYGSVDATPLWISLLHDAWRWGLPAAQVEALFPALDAALGWLRDDALGDDGFVRYVDTTGHGLANQGWKDSADAVQFADGRLATGPIALCEAQAYAYAAAVHAADVLDGFGRRGADAWREWAAALQDRFRERFWVDDVQGRFPAIALDRDGRPVDTVTSNLGHLLGTGLLDAEETVAVVERLGAPDLASGFGLRTMSARETGYNPLSYHCGSVWPHDTAIAIAGLAASPGPAAAETARRLVDGLLAASPAFGGRLPELYGGHAAANGHRPVPYPPACRPQAWSAAAGVVVLSAILGLSVDVPGGVVRVRPMRPSPVGELTVHGLRVAGEPLDVHVTAAGDADVLAAPNGLRVEVR